MNRDAWRSPARSCGCRAEARCASAPGRTQWGWPRARGPRGHADPAPPEPPEETLADQADHEDAEHDGGQLHVEPHVPVEDVTELMRDHALQLIAAEFLHRATRDRHDRIAGRETGGERVQAGLGVEHVNRRDQTWSR